MVLDLTSRIGRKEVLALLVSGLLLLVSYFLFPLLEAIVLGIVFSYVGRPIRDFFKIDRWVSSLIATICIITPLSVVLALGSIETIRQLRWLETYQNEIFLSVNTLFSKISIHETILDELARNMQSISEAALQFLTNLPIFSLGAAILMTVLNLLISLCVCYFILLDGRKFVHSTVLVLNIKCDALEKKCLNRIDSILCGVYEASIYTAIAGSITSIVIFYLFGVPRPFAMANIVFLAGMVPFLSWLVFIPMSVVRYFEYGLMDAILFFLVTSILVHVAELVIRPYIVQAKSSMHPLLVLLSFIGGGLVAGLTGFFLAPAMIGILMGIYQVTREEMRLSAK